MSSAPKLTKKQKKALAYRERKGKGKAKSFDDLDHDVPVEEDQDAAEVEVEEQVPPPQRPAGRPAGEAEGGREDPADMGGAQKGKKRKREEAKEGEADAGTEGAQKQNAKKKRKGEDGAGVDVDEGAAKGEKGKQRFILFVGNLKYTTTKEAVEAHFSKCDPPPTVRLMTPKLTTNSKPTNKSKGFAFVEFTHRNALQQGLKLHQSELEGRKINVELTAGGGGKSEHRLEKVKQRNKELHEQRKKQLVKRTPGKKKAEGQEGEPDGNVDMERPQRYSATSGVDQVPLKKRTWSVPENEEEAASTKKRGSKKGKKRPPKALGTGMNAIPVG